jgi:hypothetical protein
MASASVELFRLRGAGERAAGVDGLRSLPRDAIGNDVALDASGGLWVTNYQPRSRVSRSPTRRWRLGLATERSCIGEPTRPNPIGKWLPARRGPNPTESRCAGRRDARRLAFAPAASRSARSRRLARASATSRSAAIPTICSSALRRSCWRSCCTGGLGVLICRFGACPARRLAAVRDRSGERSRTSAFAHDGSRIGAVASAAEVGERLYFGSVFDDRIGLLRER